MSQEKLSGQLAALWREGAKDFHNAIVPAFPSSLHGVDEPGTPLSPTSQMVSQELGQSYEDFLGHYQGREAAGPEQGMER